MSFSRRNPIPSDNFLNTKVGSAFVNKSARFSLERICWTVIILSFWRSWVKKNFGEMCFTLSLFMYPSFNWVMQDVLSSCITVGASFSEGKLHILRIWCHISQPDTFSASVAGSKPRQALLFVVVSKWVSPVARVDSRTRESQEGTQRFILVWAIGALRPAADDPYTQEHPKSRGYNRV
jgi:hypothetical protein